MPPALLRFSALRAEDRRLRSFSDTIGKNRTPDTARSDVAVTVSHSNCRALDAADTPNANLDPLQGLSESERKTARTFQGLAMCSLQEAVNRLRVHRWDADAAANAKYEGEAPPAGITL